jgi:L-seryl-tRNA(Ser) seleniumtransferase
MAERTIKTLRDFPSVEELLQAAPVRGYVTLVPRPVAAELVRDAVAVAKGKLKSGSRSVTLTALYSEIRSRMLLAGRRRVTRVINATGIVVHTNLGRAPLPQELVDAVKEIVTGYSIVEFNLVTCTRGGRGEACEKYLAQLAGAEAATVVNNCAAALLLILNTLANRRRVLISRGELVQIGGGFRIPDILRKSGAKLAEVGTTNVTVLKDYERSLDEKTALILKVHKSNFIQAGFTQEVPLKQLVELASAHGVSVVNDLGSGVFVPTQKLLGYGEPTVQQSVRDGADLTCFSGDKMLGGVQAGLIVGRAELVTKVKRNPLFRTARVDKFVFAMLERLLAIYLNGTHQEEITLWSMLSVSESELFRRARTLLKELGSPAGLLVEATEAYVGGGALPEASMPSVGIVFSDRFNAATLMSTFRSLDPPVIGRIEGDRFILDLKAVSAEEISTLGGAVKHVLQEGAS